MFTIRGEKRRGEEKRLSPCLLAGTAAAVLLLALAGAALFAALLAIRAVDGAAGLLTRRKAGGDPALPKCR